MPFPAMLLKQPEGERGGDLYAVVLLEAVQIGPVEPFESALATCPGPVCLPVPGGSRAARHWCRDTASEAFLVPEGTHCVT